MKFENTPLHVNEAMHRFEVNIDEQIAFIDYKQTGKNVYLIHTEVPPQMEGKGIASALVEKTLQYLDEHHLQLVPLCSFVQSYLQKNPQWKRLEAEENE